MKKTLLYFEELECPLSKTLFAREDLNIIILRTTKNLKFFSKEYLEQTKNTIFMLLIMKMTFLKKLKNLKNGVKKKN